jgi:hypothetical protein
MALKLTYYGQNDSQWSPDAILTGDPGTDQQTLTAAGYLGGKIVALGTPLINSAVPVAIAPCDTEAASFKIPFAALLNGPGEFAGAIGPSGSKKAPVVRALFQGNVNVEAYDSGSTFTIGGYVYCGTSATAGKYVSYATAGTAGKLIPVGICTHVFTAAEPWLGVASLL